MEETSEEGTLSYFCLPSLKKGVNTYMEKMHSKFFPLRVDPLLERFCSPGKQTRSREYKKNFMLNSAEHEILKANKYKNIKKISFFQAQMS